MSLYAYHQNKHNAYRESDVVTYLYITYKDKGNIHTHTRIN